ncbi:molybdenum cofactor guanylyltransferase [Methanobrevibacter sp. UBA417]|jgi:molybdopterin-guanine dinucleotide biosynthesis protein A|uniref:molybdenum cofactor guanylyltransferase n=1 Tax=Methanobrevibacter sp. UBA417 TaxID=1915487 RepID=UPI0039B85F80
MKCLSCVILCGGMSRRMGQDKGSMIINEKPMIIHILDVLNYEIDDVIIVLNDESRVRKYEKIITHYQNENKKYQFHITYLTDEIKNKGPLSGIMTGLKKVKNSYALILPCDSPYIQKKFIQVMKEKLNKNPNVDAIIPKHLKNDVKSNIEPLHSIYNKGQEFLINELIENNKLKVNDFIKHLKIEYVLIDNENICEINFKNLNSKEDL